MGWQKGLADCELAELRMLDGDPNAFKEKVDAIRLLAESRGPCEIARREKHRAWMEWAHLHNANTNELLAEIRDLLTKRVNPPNMVLTSTPESRAANLIQRIEAIAASDPVFAEAEPTTEDGEVQYTPIKEPPPSPFDVQLTANEVRFMLEIVKRGSYEIVPLVVKNRLRSLELIAPLYKHQDMWSAFAKREPLYVGEVLTTAGRWWAFHAGIAPEPS